MWQALAKVDLRVRSWVERPLTYSLNDELSTSTSVWGRELKDYNADGKLVEDTVDLRVRSWVERWTAYWSNWQKRVDLRVRSWVEREANPITETDPTGRPPCEVVSWKTADEILTSGSARRPPCEVVSWKRNVHNLFCTAVSRPPCEVVSWKVICGHGSGDSGASRPPCEVVSWKTSGLLTMILSGCRPPCEVVSWKICQLIAKPKQSASTSVWGRELKDFKVFSIQSFADVDLRVRSWVESSISSSMFW